MSWFLVVLMTADCSYDQDLFSRGVRLHGCIQCSAVLLEVHLSTNRGRQLSLPDEGAKLIQHISERTAIYRGTKKDLLLTFFFFQRRIWEFV